MQRFDASNIIIKHLVTPRGGAYLGDKEVWMRPDFYTKKSPIRLKLNPKKVQQPRMLNLKKSFSLHKKRKMLTSFLSIWKKK